MVGEPTLRAQLLLVVAGPLLFLLLIESIVSYRIGMHTAGRVFDSWLLDTAQSLAHRWSDDDRSGLSKFAMASTSSGSDHVHFQVQTLEGKLLAGSTTLGPVAEVSALAAGPVYGEVVLGGGTTRAISLLREAAGQRPVIVTVAESLHKRQLMTAELLFEVTLSKAALLIAVLMIIAGALQTGLRPLTQLGNELSQRTPQDLTPITLPDAPGELRVVVDNTNRLLARIDAAIHSREQFIGNIAHQIRTPLAGMKLQAQLALDEEGTSTSVRQAIERIVQSADVMAHVNSQLMKLARAESASGRGLRREQVDLRELTARCCAAASESAAARGTRLMVDMTPETLAVTGEQTLLAELIANLVDNAIVYGNAGGTVWISLLDRSAGPQLVIEDDGPGIAREHWPRIFERFFRPVPRDDGGCGLGLAIVREIATAHGAKVTLQEPDSGSGIRFVVDFQRA